MVLTMGSLFFFCLLVPNWILRRAYILAKLLAPSKEITMVSSPLMREKNVVQSLGLALRMAWIPGCAKKWILIIHWSLLSSSRMTHLIICSPKGDSR
uniref:Uncharacterized protein n=1 Tax=Romanomermis culicivorax TaxID=13658 RepID=A0A915HRH6_ROMCU